MIHGNKVIVVMPAYRAAQTVERTYRDIPKDVVDDVLLIDDGSPDATPEISLRLGLKTYVHDHNLGYGANQKTCYREALRNGADIVIMLHPDYQYEPRLITAMAAMIASGVYDVVLGSRILGGTALSGGMPVYKYVANRFLTFFQNLLLGIKLSEYHTGYRAFSRRLLKELPLLANSDDFVFDNQMLTQAAAFGFKIGEISCPTKYMTEASSINFRRSVKYGFGVLGTSLLYRLWKWRLCKTRLFNRRPTLRLEQDYYRAVNQPAPAAQRLPEKGSDPDRLAGALAVEHVASVSHYG
jgi:glycosyltransferase involved in cell wall biosynthesis